MQLTRFTDLALRVLIFTAARGDRPTSIREIAAFHEVSTEHIRKVVHHLGREGFLATRRGRDGGVTLALPPAQIRVGAVVRACEPDLHLVECFAGGEVACTIVGSCRLKRMLGEALESFLATLDGHTLADIVDGIPTARLTVPA